MRGQLACNALYSTCMPVKVYSSKHLLIVSMPL
jgi:hypothetical protein